MCPRLLGLTVHKGYFRFIDRPQILFCTSFSSLFFLFYISLIYFLTNSIFLIYTLSLLISLSHTLTSSISLFASLSISLSLLLSLLRSRSHSFYLVLQYTSRLSLNKIIKCLGEIKRLDPLHVRPLSDKAPCEETSGGGGGSM